MTPQDALTALQGAGWTLIDGPRHSFSGWRATIQRGEASKPATGPTANVVLADLLRSTQGGSR